MMRTPKGAYITQFNMGDSEAMGSVKYDLLTIEGLDKIRVALDQLIEDNQIQSQGTLKELIISICIQILWSITLREYGKWLAKEK